MADATFKIEFKKTIWYYILVRFPFMLGILKGKKLIDSKCEAFIIRGEDLLFQIKRNKGGNNNSDIIVK